MKLVVVVLSFAVLIAGPATANDRFTHYVMALSWNASWCAIEGNERAAEQCDRRYDYGFTLHGLWPQGEDGWPQYCATAARDPSRDMTAAMTDIMGSSGLAWHQWKKHGRCAEVSAAAYFAKSRDAYEAINRPSVLRRLDKTIRVDPNVIKDAFLDANPALAPESVAVTCRDGHIHEVRICLSKSLVPRDCTAKVARGCQARSALLPPIR